MHEQVNIETQDQELLLWASLVELSHVASIAENIDQLYDALSSTIHRFVPFDRLAIRLIDEVADTVTNVFVSGAEIPGWQPGVVYQLNSTITADLLMNCEPIILDGSSTGTIAKRRLELSSYSDMFPALLAVPLVSRGKVLGAIFLRSRTRGFFTKQHVEIIEAFTTHIAPAVENAQNVEGLAIESEERKVMLELGRTITSSLDIDSVFERFAELVSLIVPADRIAVTTINPDGKTLLNRFSSGLEVHALSSDEVMMLEGTITRAALENGAPMAFHVRGATEIEKLLNRYPALKPTIESGVNSILVSPMVSESKIVGAFHAQSKKKLAYSPKHEELIQQVAAFAASAIAKSDLMRRIERESTERRTLAEMGRIIGSTLDFGDVFERIADEVRKLLPADRVVITTVDDEAETITDRYISGPALPVWDSERTRRLKGLPTESVVKDRKAMVTFSESDFDDQQRTEGLVESREIGLHSAMFAPLISDDRVIGTISVKASVPNAYSDADLDVLRAIALQIAGAVGASDLYLETLRLANEREKRVQAESENRELQRINRAKSEFLSTVSHELKTPLTSILAFTGVLRRNRDDELSARELKHLEVIKRNGERLNRLISDLVDVSRLQANTINLMPMRFDLNEIILDLQDSFRPVLAEKSQFISVSSPGGEIHLHADPDRVTQVIANLVSNASKYSHAETEIKVNVEVDGGFVSVTVSDQGIGLTVEDQEQLFTAFFRADNEIARAQSGTGLGLVIAKSIAEMHGGDLTVESEPGKGSKFTFTVPLEFRSAG